MTDKKTVKIYKIYPNVENPDDGDVYFGSTTKKYSHSRLAQHRYIYNLTKSIDTNLFNCRVSLLFDKYGIEKCILEVIEEFDFINKELQYEREAFYIKNFKCVNKTKPIPQTKEEKNKSSNNYYHNVIKNDKEKYDIFKKRCKESMKKSYEKKKFIKLLENIGGIEYNNSIELIN